MKTGESDLEVLLNIMKPELHQGEFVFCTYPHIAGIPIADICFFLRESEGITVVLEKQTADALELSYQYVASWVTLSVHSALSAVGLTAAFSSALAAGGISCNVVAGYYHDHIFVDRKEAPAAIELLNKLSGNPLDRS